MKQIIKTIWDFIAANKSRFILEFVAVAIGIVSTWAISQLTGQGKLQACQDERTELLRENASAQSFADSVKWSAVLQEKINQIKHLENENLSLREKQALDSISAVTKLDAMRSINKRYQGKH